MKKYLTVPTMQMVLCLKLVSLETDSEAEIYKQEKSLWNNICKEVRVADWADQGVELQCN